MPVKIKLCSRQIIFLHNQTLMELFIYSLISAAFIQRSSHVLLNYEWIFLSEQAHDQ